jgi:serine/threonine protein kinase
VRVLDVPASSPLKSVLETGRFASQFRDIKLIGEGGFGKVFHANLSIGSSERKPVAIKVVRLYVPETDDAVEALYQHRAYREVLAMQKVQSENTVRFQAAWFEELDAADQ